MCLQQQQQQQKQLLQRRDSCSRSWSSRSCSRFCYPSINHQQLLLLPFFSQMLMLIPILLLRLPIIMQMFPLLINEEAVSALLRLPQDPLPRLPALSSQAEQPCRLRASSRGVRARLPSRASFTAPTPLHTFASVEARILSVPRFRPDWPGLRRVWVGPTATQD